METENAASEQDCKGNEPQKEHLWLQKFVGEWTSEMSTEPQPGQMECGMFKGTESTRTLGGLWVLGEGTGEMPGGEPVKTQVMLGYDPQKKRFVGTWIGSMMTHLWVYEGELDADEKALALYAEGPSMKDDGKTARYRDTMTLESNDHRILTSHVQGEDGEWHLFMTAHYHRVK